MTASTVPAPARSAVSVALAVLLLGLLLWDVRVVLQPLVVFPLLLFVLWPLRADPLASRTIMAICLVFAVWFIATMGGILAPFAIAFAIAYLLAPVVAALVRRRVPRPLAIAMVLLPFLGAIVGLIVLLVPEIQTQLFELTGRIPQLAQRAADWALALRQRLLVGGSSILTDAQIERLRNIQASDLVALVSDKWDALSQHLGDVVLGLGRGVGVGLLLVLTVLGYVLVAPIVSFYLLLSWPTLQGHVVELVPPAERPAVFGFLKEYDQQLGRFVRGQLTEATLVATLTTVGLALLGFPGAIVMGVISGLGNLIPTVGLFLSVIPGVLIALTAPEVGPALLHFGIVFAAVQILDGQVTGPKIVGGSVGLNPVWMMLSVLIFGALLGIVGMFLAVPLAVFCKMLVVRAVGRYRASPVYGLNAQS